MLVRTVAGLALAGLALAGLAAAFAVPSAAPSAPAPPAQGDEPAFGRQEDVAFARALWEAMGDFDAWRLDSEVYPGSPPHGAFLRLHANWVVVEGTSYPVVVKENYGGEDATQENVAADPDAYLAAVTVMVQREEGYSDHDSWFFVKYRPDGSVDQAPQGRALAGSVTSCIACHEQAEADYLYINDPE